MKKKVKLSGCEHVWVSAPAPGERLGDVLRCSLCSAYGYKRMRAFGPRTSAIPYLCRGGCGKEGTIMGKRDGRMKLTYWCSECPQETETKLRKKGRPPVRYGEA